MSQAISSATIASASSSVGGRNSMRRGTIIGGAMAVADFTLGDLLAHEELALELVSGGGDALRRRVAGAHSIEIERPSSWLAPEWVMLTAGTRLRGSADAQRELVRELDDAGVGALGLGLDLVFKTVPRALLSEAVRREFPVFTVPLRTPFREITTVINRALLSDDLRTYQRLASMQLYLVDALREAEPRQVVVARLAELLDASVLVLSPAGAVELAAGDAPAEALWAAIDERPVALHELDVAGWHAVATPVLAASDGDPVEWLVIASRRSAFAHGLTKPVAQAAAPLLAATARLGETERAQARAVRAALLEELLARAGGDPAPTAPAGSFGLDFSQPARVVALRGAATLPSPSLELERDGVVFALVQAPREVLRERLADAGAAGVGRPITSAREVPHSFRDAELALQRVAF